MEENFTKEDIKYIQERGNSLEKIEQQLFYFKNGIPKINLVKPAIINDGILALNALEVEEYSVFFDANKTNYSIEKFVPASGAATRMFKFLNEFLNEFDLDNDTINSYINKCKAKDLSIFIIGLKKFPFYQKLKTKTIELHPDYASCVVNKKHFLLIKTLLSTNGLNYAQKPKGILPFHNNGARNFTPIEENILESSFYACTNKKTKIHFTINEEFLLDFQSITNSFQHFEINFSYQDSASDTLAVDKNNVPFRLKDGNLFFRPGGHGALIENLNCLNSNFIFLKNIDNVAQNNKVIISNYKKVLGSIIIKTQQKVFDYLKDLESIEINDAKLLEIIAFAQKKLSFSVSEDFVHFKNSYKAAYLTKVLNRPIRVCGMVKNEGEPGGGPFWIKDDKGKQTLQIVESSQIDSFNKNQIKIAKKATHFNPVDIVCGVYDYKGNKFDLKQFIDHKAAFITEKNKNGTLIKAIELPGLWNGAMAKWTTIFVEIPLETFNPVKTVNDLLKPAHQNDNE